MRKKGFTLVELIAVIIIIGILAVIVLPNVVNLFIDAKKNTFLNESQEIYKSAISSYVYDTASSKDYFIYGNGIVNTGSAQVKKLSLSGIDKMRFIVQFDKEGNVTYFYTEDANYKLELGNMNSEGSSVKLDDIQMSVAIENHEYLEVGKVDKEVAIIAPSSGPTSTGDASTCSPGKYLDELNNCADCPIGYYCLGGNSDKSPCPVGYAGTGIGKSTLENACSACMAGSYSNTTGSTTCKTCSPGYYNTGTGNTSCKTCEKGYYCTGGTNHTACPAGYMGTGTAKTSQANGCSACENGKYSTSEASTSCSTCASGSYNLGTGNTTCTTDTGTLCTAGNYYNKTTNKCDPCPKGFYCPAGASDKIACLAGTYTDTTGNTTCSTCPAGSYNTGTENTTCTTCESGYYCTGGTNHTACPAGSKGTGTGKKSQETGCSLCPAGTFSDELGSTTCSSCVAGTYTLTSGHVSCSTCESGYYCTGGTNHTACPAGYMGTGTSKTTQANACTACIAGTYSDSEGSETCNACSMGQYNTGTGNTSCTTCDTGTYNLGTGNTSCTTCPASSTDIRIKAQCSGSVRPIDPIDPVDPITPIDPVLPGTVDYEVISSGNASNTAAISRGYIYSKRADGIYVTVYAGNFNRGGFENYSLIVSEKDSNTVNITIDFTIGNLLITSSPYVYFKIKDTKYTNFNVKSRSGSKYNLITLGETM